MTHHPTATDLYDVCAKTWPAQQETRLGSWTIREGLGGGKRVSAASLDGPLGDIQAAEDAMTALGQDPLFMVKDGQEDLDNALNDRGYSVQDPVNLYACPVTQLTDVAIPRVTAFALWEPLHIMWDIWTEGGVGPARHAVMHRCTGPKTGILGRWNDQPAGVGFVGIHGQTAMVHALEILEHQRGQGVGGWLMRRAAQWAQDEGATYISAICTQSNAAANALYSKLGMDLIGHYHYRVQNR